jgi:pilus assembly protein CpaB
MNLPRRRPPTSALVYLALAVALSCGAAALMDSYARQLRATRPDVGPPTEVVVAAASLPRGTVLGVDDLETATIPATLLPPGSMLAPDGVTGRELVADIARGEILTTTRLAGADAGPLSALVPAGLRAFSIPVAVTPGSVSPGDLIDVIGTFGANGGRPYTDTVASGLEIVLVSAPRSGSITTASTSEAPNGTVTVLADPITVESLARAAATGIVSFAVVGADG